MELGRRLLRRPRPYSDESLAGYIIRLSQANYYESPKWIFQMSGLRLRGIYANVFNQEKDDLSGLSNISDVEVGMLWSMAFPAVAFSHPNVVRQVKVFGNVVLTSTLNYNRVQLCPICLQESPYYRSIWDLSVVSACPFHDCLLINRCPSCHQEIKWSRPSVVRCQCEFDWRCFQPVVLSNKQIALSRHIYKLCQVADLPQGDSAYISEENPVGQLNLSSFVELLASLLKFGRLPGIRYQVFPRRETPGGISFGQERIYDRVFALVKDWPVTFYQLMDVHERYLDPENSSFYVSSLLYQDWLDFFAAVFIWFAQDSWSFIQVFFEEYFERFLRKYSLKKLQIFFVKDFQFYSVSIPVTSENYLKEQLASKPELEGLTLAKLFVFSRIEIYNQTVFFRMNYFPD